MATVGFCSPVNSFNNNPLNRFKVTMVSPPPLQPGQLTDQQKALIKAKKVSFHSDLVVLEHRCQDAFRTRSSSLERKSSLKKIPQQFPIFDLTAEQLKPMRVRNLVMPRGARCSSRCAKCNVAMQKSSSKSSTEAKSPTRSPTKLIKNTIIVTRVIPVEKPAGGPIQERVIEMGPLQKRSVSSQR